MSVARKQNFYFGLWAEYLTIAIYKLKLYKVLFHRLKTYKGEIDLIACRGNTLVFIEVKARSKSMEDKIITASQQSRIKNSATLFLAQNPKYQNYDMRFDFVFIQKFKLPIIIKNAW